MNASTSTVRRSDAPDELFDHIAGTVIARLHAPPVHTPTTHTPL